MEQNDPRQPKSIRPILRIFPQFPFPGVRGVRIDFCDGGMALLFEDEAIELIDRLTWRGDHYAAGWLLEILPTQYTGKKKDPIQ